jgi:Glycosyl hydrolase family 12
MKRLHRFFTTAGFILSILSGRALALTYATADSWFKLGSPASVSQQYSSCASFATITKAGNPSDQLWLLDPCPWGASSGDGKTTMSYSTSSGVTSSINYSGINSAPVNGYPFLFYGCDPYGDPCILGQPPRFPAQLSAMKSLYIDLRYAMNISGTAPGDMDIAFDQWLTPTGSHNSGDSGSVEVLIGSYVVFAESSQGTFVKTIGVPAAVNGAETVLYFNKYNNGTGGGDFVVFEPTWNLKNAEISFDMMILLRQAARVSGVGASWYLAGMEFGTEFGDGPAPDFTFNITKFSFSQVE